MSLNNWLSARGSEYSTALSQAKAAYDINPSSPAASVAYAALVTLANGNTNGWTTSILNSLRTGSTSESEITLMQDFLADDITNNSGTHAAALGLTVQTQVDTGARTGLGGLGVTGGKYRRWKGQPLYTFGEGLLIGKNNQVIAVFGDHPAEIASAGFGTDGLIFFDGKPMSKNTSTPGVVVFGGDLMVSGSIRGDGGVVVIDDVIQLETGVANPAGIALDSSGKIKLRHRGQGFTQFIDPALTQTAAENAAKVWVSEQNTNATRLSDSIIPNSNFDTKEYFQQSSTYYSRPAGVAAVGTADKTSISYPSGQPGVLKMNPDSDSTFGFVLPAVDVSEGGYEGKFNIKIRYSSDSSSTISQGATSGIFIYVCETNATPTQFADKKYVYDTTNPTNNLPVTAVQESRTDYYETNVTFTALTSPSLDIPANGTWNVQSYDFTKQSTTTYVSVLVFVQNIGAQSLFVDYVSMKPIQVTQSQIEGLVTTATSNITAEAGSILQNASLTSLQSGYGNVPEHFIKTKTTGGSSYATFAEAQGDNYSSDNTDKGVSITAASGQSNVGMVSKVFDRDALLYTVGARVKALADATTYRLVAVESNFDTSGVFMDANTISYNLPYDAGDASVRRVTDSSAGTTNGTVVGIKVAELQSDGTYNAQDTDPLTVTKDISDGWITILGTYKPTRTASGTDSNVRKISLMIEVTSTAGSIAVDFLYVQRQTSTADIASTLADEAYSDAQAYVSVLNSFVAKEQGSLIPNAQMGVQEFIKGSGSSVANHIRPSGFRYVGFNASANSGNGDGYLLSYAPTSAGLGKDAVMKVQLGGTTDLTKGFTTPPFPVGTDRYSVIIRGQRVSSAGTIRAGINYTTGTLLTGKSTIAGNSPITVNSASKSVTYESDVQTGASVVFQELTLNDNTMYSSMTNHTATWDLVGSDLANPNIANYDDVQLASLTVLASQDFYIDYLYIVPQTISSNIATLSDNSVRNFFNEINELSEQENDSLIGNGNFTIPKSSNTNLPSNWYPTSGTTFQFVQHSSSGNTVTYISPDTGGTNASNLNGNGTMIGVKYTPGSGCRIYSGVLNLPNQQATTYTDSDGNTVSPSSTGQKYTVFAKVRTHSGSGNKARVQLKYHDTTASITNETHIYDNTLASADSANGKSDASGGQTGNIDCVNITAGTDAGSASYEDVRSTSWQTIGGTYTARSTAKHVSFSIDITFPDGGQPTANSNGSEPTTFFYIDYFYVGIQTMTSDIAIALAQAESDIKISPLQTSITNLQNTVELEDPSLSLITNSTFANLYDTSNPDIAKYWVATRSTKNAVEVYPSGTASITSIGTYATPYNATGEADNNYGMLSKLVVEPALAVTTYSFDSLGLTTSSLGKYNVIVRCRGTGSNPYSVQIIAHEKYTALAANATHVIDAAVSVTSVNSNIGVTLDTFTNNNSAGKSTTLNAIDLGNSGASANTTQNITTNITDWRNVLATYTPDPRAHAVSFEFRFNADQDGDTNDAIIYVDSVHMEVSTANQDLVISLANERAETAETFANAAAAAAGSEAQQALAGLFAAADSEAAQTRDNINQAVLSEQGSIMYNSSFAYQESFGAGTNTSPSADSGNSGTMTPTITSVNATSSGQYKIILQDTGSTTTSSGGITSTTPAKYKVQKYVSSSWTTLKDNANNDLVFNSDTSATPISNTGILVTWNKVTDGGATDFWTWTTTAYQRPIGYRLARVNHNGNANFKKNLTYHTAPGDGSAGGAKIAIMEDGTGYQNLATTSYSLLCPPVLVPSDSQATAYQVAAKVKVGTSDTQFLAVRIHEIFDYFDQDTYVTFVASNSNTKNFTSPSDATPPNNAYNVTTSKGIASTHVESDVYRFNPSATDVPLRSVFNSWSGYDSSHTDWPVGRTQDVTVVKLSEFDTTSGSTESFGNSFVTIGGGFDTSKDCKMFVVELIFSSVANNSSTIIDYIHVAQSTIGASAASDIANANIATSLADYTTTANLGSSIGTYLTNNSYPGKDGTVTDADLTLARTDLEETIQGLNTDGFVQPNQRFANQAGLTGDATHKIPEGYSLHRYKDVAHSSKMGHATNDLRKLISYPTGTTHGISNSNPVIMVQETNASTDYNFALVAPYIPSSNLTAYEGISFAMKLKLDGDTSATLYVRAHQIFSDPSSTNGLDGNVATCVIQDNVYDFSDSGGTSYSATDITETTDNDRCPDAAFFRGVDFHVTQAQAKNSGNSPTWNASVSTPLGTVWECNLIDLTDETDTSATTSKGITNSYKVIGGSFPVHESAVAISLEFYVEGVGASDYVVFDDFSVDGMTTFVDQAVLKSVDRVTDTVEEIEEERIASLTNVIQNPSFLHTERVDANGRYQVPKSWRYTGAAGDLWGIGYRSTPTGILVNPDDLGPKSKKYATLANIGHRGITSQGGSTTTKYYLNHGAVSKPFAVADDLYEWEIKLTLENGGYEGVRLFVLEYDTASPKPHWIKPHTVRAVGSTSKDMGQMDSIPSHRNLVTATRHFCLHSNVADTTLTYSYSSSTRDNGVIYHSGTDISVAADNITQIKDGSTTTLSSNVRYLGWNGGGGTYTWSGNYTPTSTAKYAAVWICFYGSALNKNILHHVEMLADKVSSNAITARNARLGLSAFAGQSVQGALSSRFGTPADTTTTLFAGIALNVGLFNNPTSPEVPSLDAGDISLKPGFSAFTSTTETSSTISNKFTVASRDVQIGAGTNNQNRPNTLKYTYDDISAKNPNGGLVYAAPIYYKNQSGLTTNLGLWNRGVSYFSPATSEYVGITNSGKQLWIKNHATDGASVIFYDNDSATDRWSLGYRGSDDSFRFYKNGSTAFYISDSGGLHPQGTSYLDTTYIDGNLYIRPQTDSAIQLRLYSNQDSSSYWGMYYDEILGSSTTYNVLRFYYYKGASGGDTGSGGYLKRDSDVGQMTFTGQHRNMLDDSIKFTEEHIGLIVVSTGKYKNVSYPDQENKISKPTINESLPLVKLASKRNDKACWGVLSGHEDPNSAERETGTCWVSVHPKEEGDDRAIVNSLGEGAIWVCNINGNLENGDYITTCEIPGHGMLQDDDLLHNYTVAKITQDCTFELDNPYYDCVEFVHEGNTYRKAFVGCTYHCG